MTVLNLDWVKENFNKENLVVFDIGAADMEVSKIIRHMIPTASLYAFEAFDYWHEENEKTSLQLGIHYYKGAVSGIDGTVAFNPCLTEQGRNHPFSGSIFAPLSSHVDAHQQVYGDQVTIHSIRLETFCEEHGVTPDFIHIDVEGAEVQVLANMGKHKPKCIWAETCAFSCYDTSVTCDDLDSLLTALGYYKVYAGSADSLYCQIGFNITPYVPLESK